MYIHSFIQIEVGQEEGEISYRIDNSSSDIESTSDGILNGVGSLESQSEENNKRIKHPYMVDRITN
jgi:hypothetical protein